MGRPPPLITLTTDFGTADPTATPLGPTNDDVGDSPPDVGIAAGLTVGETAPAASGVSAGV